MIRRPLRPPLCTSTVPTDAKETTLMKSSSAIPAHRRHQRGFALAYVGICLLTLTAFAVIGIDVARLAFTASEVQSVADVAATAAALAKMQGSSDPVAQAKKAILENKIDGVAADIGAGKGIDSITPGRW